jgi:hypothetical protein
MWLSGKALRKEGRKEGGRRKEGRKERRTDQPRLRPLLWRFTFEKYRTCGKVPKERL